MLLDVRQDKVLFSRDSILWVRILGLHTWLAWGFLVWKIGHIMPRTWRNESRTTKPTKTGGQSSKKKASTSSNHCLNVFCVVYALKIVPTNLKSVLSYAYHMRSSSICRETKKNYDVQVRARIFNFRSRSPRIPGAAAAERYPEGSRSKPNIPWSFGWRTGA